LRALLDAAPVRGVVVIGVSGGLSAGLAPGTLVVAGDVRDDSGGVLRPDAAWLRRATDRGALAGTVLSTRDLLCSGASKAAAAAALGTSAPAVVDLESAAYAREAATRGLPCVIARCVLDTASESLPFDLNACRDESGSVVRSRVLARILRRPGSAGRFLALRRRLRSCAARLAGFTERLLDTEAA
jgi:nucleoside phosphorylase